MKTCTKCFLELPDSAFRTRIEKRVSLSCKYLNNTCKKCDSKLQQERHNKNKDDPEYKAKATLRAKRFAVNNKEYISERMQQKRQTQEYKEYVKMYYEKNRAKIRCQHSKVNDKYIREQRDKITDVYAISQICHPRNGITRDMVTKEMVEIKKIDIAIKRLKKAIKKYEQEN